MKEQILDIMKQVFNISIISDSPSQTEVAQWDSLRHLNLMIELEIEFDVEFEPEEIAKMKSIDEIIAVINSKRM